MTFILQFWIKLLKLGNFNSLKISDSNTLFSSWIKFKVNASYNNETLFFIFALFNVNCKPTLKHSCICLLKKKYIFFCSKTNIANIVSRFSVHETYYFIIQIKHKTMLKKYLLFDSFLKKKNLIPNESKQE